MLGKNTTINSNNLIEQYKLILIQDILNTFYHKIVTHNLIKIH